MLKIKLLHLTK